MRRVSRRGDIGAALLLLLLDAVLLVVLLLGVVVSGGLTGDAAYLTQALTAGLPPDVGSPVGLVRRRLNDK
ncbi:MarR family transcriptional regulator, partial [Streptomyces sp. NPDC053728]